MPASSATGCRISGIPGKRSPSRACQPHLEAELEQLRNVRVVVALGRIAFDVWWRVAGTNGVPVKPRPAFAHGAVYKQMAGPAVIASYHPSRQNTNTGKLTPQMMSSVFRKAAQLVRPDA